MLCADHRPSVSPLILKGARRAISTDKPKDDLAVAASGEGAAEQAVKARAAYEKNIEYSELFSEQIKTQRGNVVTSVVFALCVFTVGLVFTLYLFRTGIAGTAIEYLKLGPIALSSISLPFPLRMYLSYRIRLPLYRRFKCSFEKNAELGIEPDPRLVDAAENALNPLYKPD